MGRFDDLIEKYSLGTLSNSELDELNVFLLDKDNQEYFKKVVGVGYRLALESTKINSEEKSQAYLRLTRKLKPVKRLRLRELYKIAAVFVVLIGIGGYFLFQGVLFKDVEKQQITLELTGGELKTLSGKAFKVKTADDALLVERIGDTLKYAALKPAKALAFNAVTVPYGNKLIVKLADGSVIHLNSGSRLRYPVAFNTHGERRVNFEGEGYFEVAHDSLRPFIVQTDKLEVAVLGTVFNLSAYPDDAMVNTVLVEGKVALKTPGNPETLLAPGMMGSYSKTTALMETSRVNTARYTAWTKGMLIFEEADFEEIARELQRQFDVTIRFENEKLKEQQFTAKFKNESIEHILKFLNKSYDFQYAVEGTNILIR